MFTCLSSFLLLGLCVLSRGETRKLNTEYLAWWLKRCVYKSKRIFQKNIWRSSLWSRAYSTEKWKVPALDKSCFATADIWIIKAHDYMCKIYILAVWLNVKILKNVFKTLWCGVWVLLSNKPSCMCSFWSLGQACDALQVPVI